MAPTVLAVSSEVSTGYVGNRAARAVLHELCLETMTVPTVILPHHPGHGPVAPHGIEGAEIAASLDTLERRGFLDTLGAVTGGYLRTPAQAEALAGLLRRLAERAHPPLVALDPILGDHPRGLYQPVEMVAAWRDLLPLADIAFPNTFEVGALTGTEPADAASAEAAAEMLLAAMKPGAHLVVTSLPIGPGRLGTLLLGPEGRRQVESDLLPDAPSGTGDVLAAMVVGLVLHGHDLVSALERSVGAVTELVRLGRGQRHLPLVTRARLISAALT